jgi:ABC-type uncharacterized transport system fused permease/ATPase subunit
VLNSGANLRYGLTRVRDSAEEIALGGGSKQEYERSMGLYDRVVDAIWSNLCVHLRYGIAVGVLNQFPGLILWVLMLNDIASGKLGIGDALRVHFAYDQVGKVLGFVVDNFGRFTDLQADADRLHTLLCKCDESNQAAEDTPTESIQYAFHNHSHPVQGMLQFRDPEDLFAGGGSPRRSRPPRTSYLHFSISRDCKERRECILVRECENRRAKARGS